MMDRWVTEGEKGGEQTTVCQSGEGFWFCQVSLDLSGVRVA